MKSRNRIATISRRRIVSFLFFIAAFVLTEIGRDVYRPYIYDNQIDDFGIANTIGNALGSIAIIFFTITIAHSIYRDSLIIIGVATLGLIIYEFFQPLLIGSTFDWEDIIATLFGGVISLALHQMIPRNGSNSDNQNT
jgi:hypothetical protein